MVYDMGDVEAYLGHDVSRGLAIIFVCCVIVIIAAMIDMWTGVDAARANKERIRSHSLRKTVRKVIDYLRIVLFGCLIDILGLFFPWYDIPYACAVVTLGVILIEGKSVIENLKRKRSSAAQVIDIVAKIIECADEKDARKLIGIIRGEQIKEADNGDDK